MRVREHVLGHLWGKRQIDGFDLWLRSGFSQLMHMDSLRLTWYLVGAESKILKQFKVREVRQNSEAYNAYNRKDLSHDVCLCMRMEKYRLSFL